jgi:hypothetical protein
MSNPKPDLDLIRRVQQARMMHDSAAKPSDISGVYWIEAKPHHPLPPPTTRAGNWWFATTRMAADELWEHVRQATQNGKLGYKSKISTAPAAGQSHPDARMIVICLRDTQDAADLERIRTTLHDLGLSDQIIQTS